MDDRELPEDVEDDFDDIDDGEDGHKICSKADVPITGRSSDPDDALSSGGEYRKRSTSNVVTGAGINASMIEQNNLQINKNSVAW